MNSILKLNPWIKAVLAISLIANVVMAGMALGTLWRPKAGDMRDIGLGPIAYALGAEERKFYRKELLARLPELKHGRETLRSDFDALQAALLKEPYDPAASQAAMSLLFGRTTNRLDVSQSILIEMLNQMSQADRVEFANKLSGIFKNQRHN